MTVEEHKRQLETDFDDVKLEELTEKYTMQLALYCKAAEYILGEPVRQAFLYSFTLDCMIEADLQTAEF